jgi:hypothetical protein
VILLYRIMYRQGSPAPAGEAGGQAGRGVPGGERVLARGAEGTVRSR